MKKAVRQESAVIEDLLALTREPGYVHAIAEICHRDNMVIYSDEMKSEDMQSLFGHSRLIRTEITTVLGLLVRSKIDVSTVSDSKKIVEYVERTDQIMAELHNVIAHPMFQSLFDSASSGKPGADLGAGAVMREPIFYGGESAYSFQYRDLAPEKYRADDAWFIQNKGFSIDQGKAIALAMCLLMNERATIAFNEGKKSKSRPTSWLSEFEYTTDEIVSQSGVPIEQVQAFLAAFTLQGENEQFKTISDFNAVAATPLLLTERNTVLLFQQYSVYEALYESPFYWMMADETYQPKATEHRGQFTEEFTAERLTQVFGAQRVHSNVILAKSKGVTAGEIDVLVIFGNRLVIVQAKSKKLTLEARRGNDGQLRKDFAAAIQDSYDQAWLCAQLVLDGKCKLLNSDGEEIQLPHTPKEIFIFNVVAEHYPALAYQVRQYLKYQTSSQILAPFVMDVFFLDAMTEMLETPLRFLSYCKLRIENIERLSMSHELTALGFHLKRNLWLESDFDMVMLEDDIAIDLDVAMTVRRDNVPGTWTPEGILTRLAGTRYEHLVKQIEKSPNPSTIELGFVLLTLGEDSCRRISNGLDYITGQTGSDGRLHDFTVGSKQGGITFHCNPVPSDAAVAKLGNYCERRKYVQKATQWFGLSLDPSGALQFGVALDHEWQKSDEMDAATAGMRKPMPASILSRAAPPTRKEKVGRNDLCPCGSAKKFKKCCLQ